MTWPSNHHKLAAGTMFTLFFAGKDFAPDLKIDGVNIQDFLQGHYIAAMARVGEHIRDVCFSSLVVLRECAASIVSDRATCVLTTAEKLATEDNVVGFDTLNEPNLGMIGWHDLTVGSKFLKQGPSPTWFDCHSTRGRV